MKVADLYIRVSTDEQADKGYSLRDQEERLKKYCEIQGISVRRVIQDDFSAKTFDRPAWKRYLIDLKKDKGGTGLLLFTKWDRFSRNAGDAYSMIGTLRKLGMEPQAVEQPLDLSVPENKMMLAFYLAAPEVENDRRALNTFHGMRRAMKEGRYMGLAPKGYRNKITEAGKKYIAPDETLSPIIRWAFEQVADGKFATEQIWKEAVKKGLKVNKKNFWIIVRNPVYMGKILIPKWKDEDEQLIDGTHEGIISPSLFYEAQDALYGRRRTQRTQIKVDDSMPLRGFLMCPKCFRMLTGSASRGKSGKRYPYYHCTTTCGCRYRASFANDLFIKELDRYTIKDPGYAELYSAVIIDEYGRLHEGRETEQRAIQAKLNEAYCELNRSREMVMKGLIAPDDFQAMRRMCDDKIARLQAATEEMNGDKMDIDKYLKKISRIATSLSKLYMSAPIDKKREIVGSIFPENLTFDGKQYRTPRVNEVISLICSVDKVFEGHKNGVHSKISSMYPEVTL